MCAVILKPKSTLGTGAPGLTIVASRCGFRFGDGVEPFVEGHGSLHAGERDPVVVERDLADASMSLPR
jgi:hypothetical protein